MPGVRTTHPDYDRFAPKWQRCRDVIAGQDAMQAAAERYLPKLKDETQSDYDARRKRSDFFNGTWRTIDALNGMAFRKPPTVNVPAGINSYLYDITMSGLTMEGLAKEVNEEVLSVGRMGILVDHPIAPENVTAISQAAAQQQGLRPTLQTYLAETIRNWKFDRINNAWVLVMVVLGETQAIPVDEFTVKQEPRYRVLDLDGGFYRQRLFRIDDKGNDELLSEFTPLMNGKPLTYIPFRFVGAGGANDCIDEPPLIDLVDKNVAHYQVNADYRHGLHFTALPTATVSGYAPTDKSEKLYIGSTSAWVFPDPQARATFMEFTGQGLGAVEKALDRIETQMALLGARMIADESKQVETLGATQIKRAGENGVLSKIVQSVSEALEWALGVLAEWAGAGSAKIIYQLNRDFLPALMDGRELTALVQAYVAGVVSEKEFFILLQRGDVIDGEKTFEQHQEEIASQPKPTRPTGPANPTGTQVAA